MKEIVDKARTLISAQGDSKNKKSEEAPLTVVRPVYAKGLTFGGTTHWTTDLC